MQERGETVEHRTAIGHAGQLVGHRQHVHPQGAAVLEDRQHGQQQHQRDGQDDHGRLQAPDAAGLGERALVRLVLPLEGRVLLVLGRGIELHFQGRETLVELVLQQLVGSRLGLDLPLVGVAPVTRLRVHGREFRVHLVELIERVRLLEIHLGGFQGRGGLGQALQLM